MVVRITGLCVLLALSACLDRAVAQNPAAAPAPAPAATDDVVSQQAARLEAELGKYKDASPEAAEVMVKLINLYHAHGRTYGLARVGQQFTSAHPSDPRHKEVMLKLLDGLEALSRNKEFSAACRQFLSRYPQDPQCTAIEMRLADTLAQLDDPLRAGEACLVVWKRQGATELGRRYAAQAMRHFAALNNLEGMTRGGAVADELVDALPGGEFLQHLAWQGFAEFRRASQWAKANSLGAKMLAKNVAGEPRRQRDLHALMAENFANLGQYANAADSLRKARALGDSPLLHAQLVTRLAQAGTKGVEFEPLVNEYLQKYPARPDRFLLQSYLAHALLRDGDKPRALAMITGLLATDAISNNSAAVLVQQNGAEPPQVAASEAALRAAIAQNKAQAAYLRYVLTFEVCRDRQKDLAKARAVIRETLTQSPSDDSYTTSAADWLLSNPGSEDEFRADVALLLKARRDHIHFIYLRDTAKNWATQASRVKELQERSNYVLAELAKADADMVVKTWLEQKNSQHPPGGALREQLREPAIFNTLNDGLARALLATQAEYYRYYSPATDRPKTATVWAQLCQRFPQDFPAAVGYLEAATDYAPPDISKAAALHLLRLESPANYPDVWRRLMIAADRANDAALAKQALAWIQKSEQQFGPEPTYASAIGDTLAKFQLEAEAVAWWTKYLTADRTHSESRECATRLLARLKEPAQRAPLLQDLMKADTDYHARYALWYATDLFQAGDWAGFERILREARRRQNERPFRLWDVDFNIANLWLEALRTDMKLTPDVKRQLLTVIRDIDLQPTSAAAQLMLVEAAPPESLTPIARLLAYRNATREVGNEWYDWDRLAVFAQGALERKEYLTAATLATGMLANVTNVDEPRKKGARDTVTQSYARMGAVGLTLDDNSPLAPLFQATLYLRLGDERLAFDAYNANRPLFDEHRAELPVDLVLFVCDRLMAAGGDENHDRVEETLRGWLVKNSESKQIDDATKARVQLALARNYFKAQRYDLARNEYTTVVNRYPGAAAAVEAEFGVGETYMAQKVYDQAELVFDRLARSTEVDVVVRAEFLRGVLAFRRGDRDEARDIFRAVLERVPNVDLANQALYSLAEVYGAEERYIDQLNLLRTVGRLGRSSKRLHMPGQPLSIVVHDGDLGISRGHNRIPVRVTTKPGGDSELIYLTSAGAGKGLFRVDLETRLGPATPDDRVLQLTGHDVIYCDYPPEFKAEFKTVPLSDVEIRVAADARLEAASGKIIDKQQISFSEQLRLDAQRAENADRRVSQARPENQIKPGNPIYLRVKDADRDLSNEPDQVVVKLTADSGDQVQVPLLETGPHTGIFEAAAATGELPAGARASDTAIDHSPLMAIDRDPQTYWMSQPDGATPKSLSVDMKELRPATRVRISTPNVARNAPVRGELRGSQDGEFWFRLAQNPPPLPVAPVAGEFGAMRRRVYAANLTQATLWSQVVDLTKSGAPLDDSMVEELSWQRAADADDAQQPATVVWHGKLVQPRDGAARIRVEGARTGVMLDGREELAIGPGGRSVDVWLTAGAHDLTIFAATAQGQQPVEARWARSDLNRAQVTLAPFRKQDFDLQQAIVRPRPAIGPARSAAAPINLGLDSIQVHKKSENFGKSADGQKLTQWNALEDWAHWEFTAPAAGVYEVWIHYAHAGAGGTFAVEFGRQAFRANVGDTGGADQFRIEQIGTVLVDAAGRQTLALKPVDLKGGGLMELRGLTLKPSTGASVVVAETDWEFRFAPIPLRFVQLLVHEYRGEAVAISHVEIGGPQPGEIYIPTKTDVLSLANNNVLEIAGGDTVTVSYTDEVTQFESGASQLLAAKLTATYFDARVASISYDFVRTAGGGVQTERKELMRIEPGERLIVEIIDYDEDRSEQRDALKFQVLVNDEDAIELEATETQEYSGVFTKEVDTRALIAAKPGSTKGKPETSTAGASPTIESGNAVLPVKSGDRIYIRYLDGQNTFPGHAAPRESVVYVNEPSQGRVRILKSRLASVPPGSKARPDPIYSPGDDDVVSGVAFEAPLTIEVVDPDAAKDSRSTVTVSLQTTDGAKVDVECVVSGAFTNVPTELQGTRALEEGRFLGQVIMQLGGKNSVDIVPLTAEMPRGLLGRAKLDEAAENRQGVNLVTRVLNLSGKDLITATYRDERRPEGKQLALSAQGRLIANGGLAATDRDYEKDVHQLHVGEKLFLRVADPDQDSSDARDTVHVEITGALGERETVTLEETLSHSGVFTGSLSLKANDKPIAGNLIASDPFLETYFGDTLRVRYVDRAAATESGELESLAELPVVVGTDGLVSAFSKTFNNEQLAVETRFRIAESYFELFKSHKTLERTEEKNTDLESGRRILREVMEDYPDPKYAPRIAYLLGQFAQELGQWDEAIRSYELILRQYADHTLAPDAQYKLAQSYEEAGNFDLALEAYVTLAATHPKSPLIPNVMIRISDYFYKQDEFPIAAQVGEKFLERFQGHQHAPKLAFRVGQCYYKSKQYLKAAESFERFVKVFPDDTLAADALFWTGESYRLAGNNRSAFMAYLNCRGKFPASEAAKYARGRLALPEMLQTFEAEANAIDQEQ